MLKQAYQLGVRVALFDAGIIKQALGPMTLSAGYNAPSVGYTSPQSWSGPTASSAWDAALNEMPMTTPQMREPTSASSIRA